MPLIKVETDGPLEAKQREGLCAQLSKAAAELIGKPERYVQAMVVRLDGHGAMLHGGAPGPTAFVEVRSIGGLGPAVNRKLSQRVCTLLGEHGVPADRVYLNFLDVPASHWGHDGSTFG
jgi:phenylpyruvate tautomerase